MKDHRKWWMKSKHPRGVIVKEAYRIILTRRMLKRQRTSSKLLLHFLNLRLLLLLGEKLRIVGLTLISSLNVRDRSSLLLLSILNEKHCTLLHLLFHLLNRSSTGKILNLTLSKKAKANSATDRVYIKKKKPTNSQEVFSPKRRH